MISAISLFGIDCSHLNGWNLQRLLWNTSAYLVVSWHRIIFENKIFEGTLPYSLSFFRGYVYFGILCAAAFVAGLVLIEKIEVIGNYKG